MNRKPGQICKQAELAFTLGAGGVAGPVAMEWVFMEWTRCALARRCVWALALSTGMGEAASWAGPSRYTVAPEQERSLSEEYARQAEALRLEAIERLKGMVHSVQGDTQADMLMRLAELYSDQARYRYMGEMEAHERQFEACFNQEGCNPESLVADHGESRPHRERAVRLHRRILVAHPRFHRADEATYALALGLAELGDADGAMEALKDLVKRFPSSGFLPDAFVLIGERFLEEDNAFGALRAFLKASAFSESEMFGFATYKLGWCYYNVGEHDQAINALKRVVAHSEGEGDALALGEEALKDLVRFFADANQIDEAIGYFEGLGRADLVPVLLARLADMSFEQGRFGRGIELYRRLITDQPLSSERPAMQAQIIDAMRKMGRRGARAEEVDRFVEDFAQGGAWAVVQTDAVAARALVHAERQLRRLAADFHAEARKLAKGRHASAADARSLARAAYEHYLAAFGDHPQAIEVRYAFAELLFELDDFGGAYEHYLAVVQADPQGKNARFCAESAVHAAGEMLKRESMVEGELSVWEARLVAACDQFAAHFPDDDKALSILFRAAHTLYGKHQFAEAGERFQALIADAPRSKQAQLAAELLLDSFVVREDWDTLQKRAAWLLGQDFGSPAFREDTTTVLQRATFKRVEAGFSKDGSHDRAGSNYMAFFSEFPESDIAAQALNNAATHYREASMVGPAMEARLVLVDDPRFGENTPYFAEQLAALGFDRESVADFAGAADSYERLWAYERTNPNQAARAALWSAGVLREALSEPDAALRNYRAYITAYPADELVVTAWLAVGGLEESLGTWQAASDAYGQAESEALEQGARAEATYAQLRGAEALARLSPSRGRAAMERAVESHQRRQQSGKTVEDEQSFVAAMRFRLAEDLLEGFETIEIRGGCGGSEARNNREIRDAVFAKRGALLELQEALGEVIGLGQGPWGLASLVMLGSAYEELAAAVVDGDVPCHLTDSQRRIYDLQVEDSTVPLLDKAIEAYTVALDRSFELTLYDESTATAARRLAELDPESALGLAEELPEPRYLSGGRRLPGFAE
jgi:tetratricopeptide (TPR) repeat protein